MSARTVSVSAVEEVERALTTLFRKARLPRVHERLVERAGVSLDPALYAVLVRVEEHEPMRLTDLAAVLGVDASTASRQLKSLESAALVGRRSDPADGRAAVFVLSTAGRRTLARLREARHAAISHMLTGWDPRDTADLARLLDRLSVDIDRLMEAP